MFGFNKEFTFISHSMGANTNNFERASVGATECGGQGSGVWTQRDVGFALGKLRRLSMSWFLSY